MGINLTQNAAVAGSRFMRERGDEKLSRRPLLVRFRSLAGSEWSANPLGSSNTVPGGTDARASDGRRHEARRGITGPSSACVSLPQLTWIVT